MSSTPVPRVVPPDDSSAFTALRSARARWWRVHFWAALIFAPVLLVVSLTGGAYLFVDEYEQWTLPHLEHPSATARWLPAAEWIARASAAGYGITRSFVIPPDSLTAVRVLVARPARDSAAATVETELFLHPESGALLGMHDPARSLMSLIKRAHSSLLVGATGELLVEAAALWALVLVASGLVLARPRARSWAAVMLRPRLHQRTHRWRDLHAWAGTWSASLLVFLVATGLPWARIQGELVREAVNRTGAGYGGADLAPATSASRSTGSSGTGGTHAAHTEHAEHSGHTAPAPSARVPEATPRAWTLERLAPGAVTAAAATLEPDRPLDWSRDEQAERLNASLDSLRVRGLVGDVTVHLPTVASEPLLADRYPDRPQGQRTMYLDPLSTRVLADVGFANYGVGAQAVEIGVQLHTGQYFGWLNQLVMLVATLALSLLVTTGLVMWFARGAVCHRA